MKQFVRKVKDNVLLFSEGERLVRDATSNEPWGASSTLMHQIADLTCQREHYESVTNMLWKRLTDVTYPRHVLKACLLVEFLLRNGSERFVHDMKQRRRRFEALSKFTDYAENPEIGADVRAKTVHILALLDDDVRRNEERVTAARTKAKIHGMGNTSNMPRQQNSGQDDWASGKDFESPTSERNNHNRTNSDNSFEAKFSNSERKSKANDKAERKVSDSFGFDDDPLEEEYPRKSATGQQKPTKTEEEAGDDDDAPVSEKKKKKSKNQNASGESKPKKDKKKKKKEAKQDAAAPDPPSGHEDMGDFISADTTHEVTKQMSEMSFQASFDMMDAPFQGAEKTHQQASQHGQAQAQQAPASFDFFSSLQNQTITPNNASHNEWFDSKPTAKTPVTSLPNQDAVFHDFQGASSIPAKITPNQSPIQATKKPEDIWSSLTNIDSLTAPKTQASVATKQAPASMGQPQQYDPFAFGAGSQVPSQAPSSNNSGYYNGYQQQQQQQQQPPYAAPYGQMPLHPSMMQAQMPIMQGQMPQHPLMAQGQIPQHPAMMHGQMPPHPAMMQAQMPQYPGMMYQQQLPFANAGPQQGSPMAPAYAQQQKPQQPSMNIPDAFAAFGMSK